MAEEEVQALEKKGDITINELRAMKVRVAGMDDDPETCRIDYEWGMDPKTKRLFVSCGALCDECNREWSIKAEAEATKV